MGGFGDGAGDGEGDCRRGLLRTQAADEVAAGTAAVDAEPEPDAGAALRSDCSRSAASRSGLSLCLRCVITETRGLWNKGTGGGAGR